MKTGVLIQFVGAIADWGSREEGKKLIESGPVRGCQCKLSMSARSRVLEGKTLAVKIHGYGETNFFKIIKLLLAVLAVARFRIILQFNGGRSLIVFCRE
jgi:hypothetical protein